jgi:hypothetical protein
MGKAFSIYWTPGGWSALREGAPILRAFGTGFVGKIGAGDRVFITNVKGGQLRLLGGLTVGTVGYVGDLPSKDVTWDAPEFLTAASGKSMPLKARVIASADVAKLRFLVNAKPVGKVAVDEDGRVNGQAMRAIRELTPESATLLQDILGEGAAVTWDGAVVHASVDESSGTVQHEGARRLLALLQAEYTPERPFTYESAAEKLGRPIDHARAVAQMCDLLDAAAAYARTPLLALVAVRSKDGHINRKAWTGPDVPPGVKDRIVAHSLRWSFSKSDYAAIGRALDTLAGLGNHTAWDRVRSEIPQQEIFRLIAPSSPATFDDAIDDLGSDLPERRERTTTSYARDPKVRLQVLARAKGRCEYCEALGFIKVDGSRYLETHHIIALANDGQDRMSNVMALCAAHHREAHYGKRRAELESTMAARVKALAEGH